MSVKIALLGFGTVASGVPFLLKENHEKITQAAQDESRSPRSWFEMMLRRKNYKLLVMTTTL